MEPMRLIHPIYLDVPMLVSFAAALQGGLSFGSEVTHEKAASQLDTSKVSGKLGLSDLFGSLFKASVAAEMSSDNKADTSEVRRESKAHTEASIAIVLYDQLRRSTGYLVQPKSVEDFEALEPGSLVEVAGTVEKNAVNAVIDYLDAVNIFVSLQSQAAPKQQKQQQQPLEKIREALDKDRRRTPISNVLLRCSQPPATTVVVTLRTQNLRDLTMSELHKNSVRVVGKVTRIIHEGQTMSAFENYGMALLPPTTLETVFQQISSSKDVVAEFSEVQVEGPAVQLLPLMVFV